MGQLLVLSLLLLAVFLSSALGFWLLGAARSNTLGRRAVADLHHRSDRGLWRHRPHARPASKSVCRLRGADGLQPRFSARSRRPSPPVWVESATKSGRSRVRSCANCTREVKLPARRDCRPCARPRPKAEATDQARSLARRWQRARPAAHRRSSRRSARAEHRALAPLSSQRHRSSSVIGAWPVCCCKRAVLSFDGAGDGVGAAAGERIGRIGGEVAHFAGRHTQGRPFRLPRPAA